MIRYEALVALNMVSGIGSIRLKKLLEYFGKPEAILDVPAEKLMAISGVGPAIAHQIHAFKKETVDTELIQARKEGIEIVTFEDNNYPANLKEIADPPIVLYVKGALKPKDSSSVAIVGSRHASYYGLAMSRYFAAELSGLGFTIVSGMARGIDTQAHQGALSCQGRTLAVIGSGFRHIYPFENKELAEEIAQAGAVISEFPMDEKPQCQNFPRRNRVISGLSRGVLVVEAARNSGALITADFALEQGREVFALPGKVDAANSFGTNGLIKQGAKLVSSVEDIVEEFQASLNPVKKEASPNPEKDEVLDLGLLPEEQSVYDAITNEPSSFDNLVERTNLPVTRLSALLLDLQIRKFVKPLPGKRFVRILQGVEYG